MLLVPSNLVFSWLTGLFSLAWLSGGLWLVWEWYDNWARHLPADPRLLAAGLVVLALALLGQPIVAFLLGRPTPAGEPEPGRLPGGAAQRVVRPDGTVLHVEWHGPPGAPVLLCTHGWGLSGAAWWYAHLHLAGRYRLLLWDLPGLGRSRGPRDHQYSLDKLADDLRAVLDLAGEGPVVLCGHSIGGMIMQTFGRRHPEQLAGRVAGMVLTHTTYTNPLHTTWAAPLMRALERPLIRPLCALTIGLSPLVRLMNALSTLNGSAHLSIHLMQFGGRETRGQLGFIARQSLRANPAVVARGMLAMLRFDAANELPRLSVPALVVAASSDKATLPEASRVMTRQAPRATEVVLAPAGHLGLLEQHEAWAAAVAEFVDRCVPATRPGETTQAPL